MTITHTKVTYFLFAVLFMALGFLFYQNQKLQIALRSGGTYQASAGLGANASTTAALAGITVGSSQVTDNVSGVITQLGGNSMQLKDQTTGSEDSISIAADTKVQIDGAIKDPSTQQKELAAYNAHVQTLIQDPIKNKAALAALQVPTGQAVTAGTLSDLAPGDFVMVTASSVASGNVYVASLISKSAASTPVQ